MACTEIALEPKAFAVLEALLESPGKAFGRDELLDRVWGHRHVTPGVLNRVVAKGLDPDKTPLSTVMTSSLQTASPDKPLAHALHMMFEGGFRHVPVVENGKPVGMVSARNALGLEILQFEKELKERDHIAEIL